MTATETQAGTYQYGPKLTPDGQPVVRHDVVSIFHYFPAYMGPQKREMWLFHQNFPRSKSQQLHDDWSDSVESKLAPKLLTIRSRYKSKPLTLIDDAQFDTDAHVTDILIRVAKTHKVPAVLGDELDVMLKRSDLFRINLKTNTLLQYVGDDVDYRFDNEKNWIAVT